jgi:hypothetical protein
MKWRLLAWPISAKITVSRYMGKLFAVAISRQSFTVKYSFFYLKKLKSMAIAKHFQK